ncbi:MAG: hypothetical protein GXP62_13100 [Oligoflexia bacterium]|nr:hypothetical protein [Oligoflexia bacterium]
MPVHVSGAPDGQLRVVGATPALGDWQPAQGLVLRCAQDSCQGSLTVPAGAVLEGKPVVLSDSKGGAKPAATWADGDNRALLVAPGVRWDMAW